MAAPRMPAPATPGDLAAALEANPEAAAFYEGLPPSHKREYLGYINEAKKPETRAKRIAKTVEMLVAKARGEES